MWSKTPKDLSIPKKSKKQNPQFPLFDPIQLKSGLKNKNLSSSNQKIQNPVS